VGGRSDSAKARTIVAVDVQTAVDAEHHLIVAHEAINDGRRPPPLPGIADWAAQPDRLLSWQRRGFG
jgi:hypothetical protein